MNKALRLSEVIHKSSRRIIGLMSGMSMDGVDLACIDVTGQFPNIKVDFIGSHYLAYSSDLKHRLQLGQASTVAEISELNFLVAREFSKCVEEFLQKFNLDRNSIDAIGSHGQTVYHATSTTNPTKSTLQIGSPSLIAEVTEILTVGNFRVRDIIRGGKGAPLVSLADYILFRDPFKPVVLNNLGSISNVTVVTPRFEELLAFDTGPANMAIDFFARQAKELQSGIDTNGDLSSKGNVIPELLAKWMKDPFFKQPPPKAAGYDEFGPQKLQILSAGFMQENIADLLRTAVEFSAVTLSNAYKDFVLLRFPDLDRAIFSGGGIYNLTLMRRIRELLPQFKIEMLDKELSDAKEAIAFALLANETLSGRPGSYPFITGTQVPVVLGEIAL